MHIKNIDRRVSIAPMMDHTDKHFRYFMRLLSKHILLYTEMITTGALIHGDRKRFLDFNEIEHPIAIQLGGSDPKDLAECAKIAEDTGFDEVNLNIGCPSDRVQNGQFGACLMANAELVADCIDKIQSQIKIPVTVKTRIGIDDQDSYDFLKHFISVVSSAGCHIFNIHARKAILSGLSPKENREIPPLNYERVYQIKKQFPLLSIIINGGITELSQMRKHLEIVDGVMIGRMAYQNPYTLAKVDQCIFGESIKIQSRKEIFENYNQYVGMQVKSGVNPKSLSRHIIGLYQGQPGAKQFRRTLSDSKPKDKYDISYLQNASAMLPN